MNKTKIGLMIIMYIVVVVMTITSAFAEKTPLAPLNKGNFASFGTKGCSSDAQYHWRCVDEYPYAFTSDYLYKSFDPKATKHMGGYLETFKYRKPYVRPNTVIDYIQISNVAQRYSDKNYMMNVVLIGPGKQQKVVDTVQLTPNMKKYTTAKLEKNPFTNQAWTANDLDMLEAGIVVKGVNDGVKLAQHYVELGHHVVNK
ncbi:hypothetical protein HYY69_07085 [Candidatus Woesearchaeota archaeon]|nr:hypothetical protein [Candidatus Woesearchaeota archaeon]